MTVKLIKWDDKKGQYIKEPVEVAAISFTIGPNEKIIEVGKNKSGLTIRSPNGSFIIKMDVANQFQLEVI